MRLWQQETFEIINAGLFQVIDPGPLHAPIRSFKLGRNDKLGLILETRTAPDAKSKARDYAAGTVRLNTDTVTLQNIAGITATLSGVIPTQYVISDSYRTGESERNEEARVHQLEVALRTDIDTAYIINWLENFPSSPFVWPDSITTKTDTAETSTIGHDDCIAVFDSSSRGSFTRSAAKFVVSGVTVYLCALHNEDANGRVKPGCIIYVGRPDERFRNRVRAAISFALGVYVVDLGSTLYSKDWNVVSFKAQSAYSIDRKVFELPVLPPALSGHRFQHELTRSFLTRISNAILEKYDELNFGDLNWAYWHALCATPHIAPVHFGAAIEMLIRRYVAARPGRFPSKIIPDKSIWKTFSEEVEQTIAKLAIPEINRGILRKNLGLLNRVHQRDTMKSVLSDIRISLGSDEESAWSRRNDAAHGMEMETGDELSLIRDIKLLKVIFHRMLLRITNASDSYIDYATPGFPVRTLDTPVPSVDGT